MDKTFALTETEFFRLLSEGRVTDPQYINIHYRDFIMKVVEICSDRKNKGVAISALLFVEVEISHLQTEAEREAMNQALASFISKSLAFIRNAISKLSDMAVELVNEEEILSEITLKWVDKKVALVELGYAFHVAKVFGGSFTVKEIVRRLARLFNVEITDHYIYKKYNEIRVRGSSSDSDTKKKKKWRGDDDSRTYFLDLLVELLNTHMKKEDEEE